MLGVRLSTLAALAWLATAPSVGRAQDDAGDAAPRDREVTTSAVLIPEGGAGLRETSIVSIGLRRGISDVEGVRFVHPADVLSSQEASDDVLEAVDDLDAIADMVRSGDANAAARRAERAIEIFEANLRAVRRRNLADAYMLRAVAACQARQRRRCIEGFEYVLRFREGAEYDSERYPPQYLQFFERVRERLLTDGARGSMQITTEPPGAEVFVDGRSYGPSPVTAIGLLVGQHYVTVKAVGYEELIARAPVNAEYEETHHFELLPSERSLLLERDLGRIRDEVGSERAGRFIHGLRGYLFTNQVMVGVLRPVAGDQIDVSMYLYDLRTRFLLAQERATVPATEAGILLARDLAVELYEGVDLTGAVEAPEQELVVDEPSPFWQQWWFWTAVGVVLVSGVVAASVLGGEQDGPPDGWRRVGGTIPR